jgi:CubicO group peptidase (beta-lactamase class C family)
LAWYQPHQKGTGVASERVLQRLVERDVPGISVALVRRGRVCWVRSAGVGSVVDRHAVTADTAGLWFSMTKIATATAAVQLAERGALILDDPVGRYLPSFPAPSAGGPVTVRHLLSHTAGLANPVPVRWVHAADRPGPDSERFAAELLRRHRKVKPHPGARAVYSNLGYIALGLVIARAAGQRFEDYVRDHILRPLGMTRTDFGYQGAQAEDVALGHHPRLHPLTPLFRVILPTGIIGATHGRWLVFNRFEVDGPAYGGLIGPPADAARFLAMHTADGEYDGTRILSPDGATTMRNLSARGRKLDVGLGWFRRHTGPAGSEPYVEHLGGGGGFWNMMRLYPRQRAGVLAMGNCTAYDHHTVADWAIHEP